MLDYREKEFFNLQLLPSLRAVIPVVADYLLCFQEWVREVMAEYRIASTP